LGVVSLKLYSDMCHIPVICNNYFCSTWSIPISYLRSAIPHWMNMTACRLISVTNLMHNSFIL
jgi:hypothetical protein